MMRGRSAISSRLDLSRYGPRRAGNVTLVETGRFVFDRFVGRGAANTRVMSESSGTLAVGIAPGMLVPGTEFRASSVPSSRPPSLDPLWAPSRCRLTTMRRERSRWSAKMMCLVRGNSVTFPARAPRHRFEVEAAGGDIFAVHVSSPPARGPRRLDVGPARDRGCGGSRLPAPDPQ